jgi:TPR repeat protein
MEEKKEQIIDYLRNYLFYYHNNLTNDNIEIIYNLLINKEKIDYDDDIYNYYCGVKYEIEKNYEEMKKYYLMAIEKGYSHAMSHLGYYYQFIEKNYEEMKKYYLMAIDKGDADAMFNLGYYCHYGEINYKEMKKYYLMAIEKGNKDAINSLYLYYQYIL